jgi:transketolase
MTTGPPPSTRHVYRDYLARSLADDRRLVCLDADTGAFAGTELGGAARRCLNLGVAEQHIMGVAAGLAACGWEPFVNTMACFGAGRAGDAIKVDIAYNALPVRIVATHGGLSAAHFGPTHHALEDLGFMRTLPNMTVVVPGDAAGLPALLDQVRACPGPVYVQLGRSASPDLPVRTAGPVLGRLQVLRDGGDVVIVGTGPAAVAASLRAADLLATGGITAGVLHAHTLKPFDTTTLVGSATRARLVVTVEEHWRSGGLGSTVAEVLAETTPRRVERIGVPDAFVTRVGTHAELLDDAGLSAERIAARIRVVLTGC